MKNPFSLDGKVILITGSTRGLGWAAAQAAAEAGATVVLHGRGEAAAKARKQELEGRGLKADFLAFEMADRDAIAAAVPTIIERHGSIWGLVNNAGMLLHNTIWDETAETYEQIMSVHMIAPFLLTKAAAAEMKKSDAADRGRIVNISSIAFSSPRAGICNYTAAKGAIVGFTRAASAELGGYGIRVNAIAPGYFVTDINKERLQDEAFANKIKVRTPAARWGDPSELGGPTVFLLSGASSYVNGQLLFVDGGMSHFLHSV
ncbi:5-keto-D-gluconate-5-reductase [Mesorhizobium plurifarium]|uniref:5-keto-D-gluconate-5-reductase n=1 Tax=Mesorhizobium plurifarium TaxID=69974 RepID=A0A0K2VU70_MESPL|nr:5-keto-D-gluconate-5-reductase [Mesorhizobium plurifarium]